MPDPQAGGPLLVGCLRLLIQYVWYYSPYLEAVSSIYNLRMRHAVHNFVVLDKTVSYYNFKAILKHFLLMYDI
jgi:hypothetical protein